jgi:psp operon transcriptional activator
MPNPSNAPNAALIGQSPEFLALLEHVSLAAPLNRPVLLIGARGTGKEMIAERLHFLSKRWDRAFIKLNCAALPENLLESELFGYEQGAFTGASRKHLGRFELAHQGSIFLDELALMSLRLQEKLLRVLEYGEFERLGGRETIRVDVRVLGATNADLPAMAARGEFRADLLDRLAFDVITLPPLRARRSDILPLAEHYALRMTQELQREYFAGFSAHARQMLESYSWPGNVRELRNVIERAVYRQLDATAPIDHFNFDPFASPYQTNQDPPTIQLQSAPDVNQNNDSLLTEMKSDLIAQDFTTAIKDLERKLVFDALQMHGMNQRKAAQHLQISYHQLRGLLRKYPLK